MGDDQRTTRNAGTVTGKTKINLGSGHWKLPGWINVDIDTQSLPQVCANLAAGLPFSDGVADLMHSEDFIDQLELDGARSFLGECHRILKPGGVIRILTPDPVSYTHLTLPTMIIRCSSRVWGWDC